MDEEPLLTALRLVYELSEDSACWLDHNGNCQEHSWFPFDRTECPNARALRLLKDHNYPPDGDGK